MTLLKPAPFSFPIGQNVPEWSWIVPLLKYQGRLKRQSRLKMRFSDGFYLVVNSVMSSFIY
ncbi:hypothetical protein, partial [Bergeriella denitrificans]|uniref:hypothetical protein n=1 Tax=Bergeriella denitrificans TaxID=494 RepID=UPI001C3F63ED